MKARTISSTHNTQNMTRGFWQSCEETNTFITHDPCTNKPLAEKINIWSLSMNPLLSFCFYTTNMFSECYALPLHHGTFCVYIWYVCVFARIRKYTSRAITSFSSTKPRIRSHCALHSISKGPKDCVNFGNTWAPKYSVHEYSYFERSYLIIFLPTLD